MQPGTLRVLAQEAHTQTLADEAALRQKEDDRINRQIAAELAKLFNTEVATVLTSQRYQNMPIVETDDLRFTYASSGDMGQQLVLLDVCPNCGKECASEPVNHLPQLGAIMAKFEPDSDHQC